MTIKTLPARLANQIAAGEVVERPASVIKELVENSIDAGATDILVELERGGHKRMLIRDNGKGIPKDQLGLALSRHATSKIEDIDDLESITSLGFRGEALASISSVSRLSLSSKTEEQSEAWQAHCEGREMDIELNPTAHPKGTSVEVLDLFFNTPARRKFLKAEKTEFQHVDEMLKRIALSHFHVAFTLKHNGKVIHRLPALSEELQHKRLAAICGQGFLQQSIPVLGEFEGVKIWGWCNAVGKGRRTNDLQYSFVNGRMMKDRVIIHAIKQAFEGMIDAQSYPAFVLYIEMPANELDVNVHPAKHEVRFHKTRQVHDVIYKSVSDALLHSVDTEAMEFSENPAEADTPHTNSTPPLFEQPKHGYQKDVDQKHSALSQVAHNNTDYIVPLAATRADSQSHSVSAQFRPQQHGFQGKQTSGSYKAKASVPAAASASYQNLMSRSDSQLDPKASSSTNSAEPNISSAGGWILTADNRMLFTEDKTVQLLPSFIVPATVLCKQVLASQVQQPLLMPVSVKQEGDVANIERLESLGFDIKQQMQKWILKQVPAALRHLPWVSIFPALLGHDEAFQSNEELLQFLCYQWAKSSNFSHVELGHYLAALSTSEIVALIAEYATELTLPEPAPLFNSQVTSSEH
ncbi:DNA mismatch repair endonuclease MutL [Glaciecola sp. MH2013]|uniref:DNA mismatch repair endonuclease MutL n=1 Tax=Glaciecola sp. MH2013 TaxID=2785524 RepID=UPI00189FA46F|nr:DNA mismatch repair endonuclease MutL [Glaciecola sp. MH2013]MBF7074113.1 DNA mismatch repair endonuclease MutL [Glaciecola sp. MH2013]